MINKVKKEGFVGILFFALLIGFIFNSCILKHSFFDFMYLFVIGIYLVKYLQIRKG